ncbi:PREDICTED: uncharacterized protein C5orf47 homolog [Galeopterus variegatus]|uniref:Uncharacterized protein C5orf47 homolog n=1 Tax=Galeopterus variegatus TaxID=482537 RepID=A0ABM0R712_GALVR|nr:PREDICTED: uncharacterized protein C5orf47 homolog [Galeopterus variegatus]
MAAGGRKHKQDLGRFVYVTRFGSHPCGSVLHLGGRRAQSRWCPGVGAHRSQVAPRKAAVEAGVPPSSGLSPDSQPKVPAAPGAEAAASASSQLSALSARSGPRRAARAGLIQKDASRKFDFPIPLNETSKIMTKKKKVSEWDKVYKLISRMLEENEKYRLRLKCQRSSSENSNYTS